MSPELIMELGVPENTYSKGGLCVSIKDGNIGDQDRHQESNGLPSKY